ncbi:MAG TPA: hypothetical protein VF463_07550 [Sphingobium sp.]
MTIPSDRDLLAAKKRWKKHNPGASEFDTETMAPLIASRPIYKNIKYFSCVSYSALMTAIFHALLIALAIGLSFLLVRWVAVGFLRDSNAKKN